MKQRLQTLLATEKIASSKFADILGVNRSSISHLLSGRNNPSLDFLQKVLVKFPHINPDWLLLGQGSMYRNSKEDFNIIQNNQLPFDTIDATKQDNLASRPINIDTSTNSTNKLINESKSNENEEVVKKDKAIKELKPNGAVTKPDNKKTIERIVFFYTDHSFDTYFPNK